MDFKQIAHDERLRVARMVLGSSYFLIEPLERFRRAEIGDGDAWSFLRQMDGVAYVDLPGETLESVRLALAQALDLSFEALADVVQQSPHGPLVEAFLVDHLLQREVDASVDLSTDPVVLTDVVAEPSTDESMDLDDMASVLALEKRLGLAEMCTDEHRGFCLEEVLTPQDQRQLQSRVLLSAEEFDDQQEGLAGVFYMPRPHFETFEAARAHIESAGWSCELAQGLSAYRDLGGCLQDLGPDLPEGYSWFNPTSQHELIRQLSQELSLIWLIGGSIPVQIPAMSLDGQWVMTAGSVDPFASLGQLRHYLYCFMAHHRLVADDETIDGFILHHVLQDLGLGYREAADGLHFVLPRRGLLAFLRGRPLRIGDDSLRARGGQERRSENVVTS